MIQWLIHYYLPTRMTALDFQECKTLNQIAMTIEIKSLQWSVPIREEGIKIGIEQGIELGIEQGIEKGTLLVLLKLLNRRFGPMPSSLVKRIESAGIQTLEILTDAALDLESIDQIETILDRRSVR